MAKQPTRGQLMDIAKLAGAITLEVPLQRKNAATKAAYVRWDQIYKLRELLTAAGFDLDAARARMEELNKESGRG